MDLEERRLAIQKARKPEFKTRLKIRTATNEAFQILIIFNMLA
jgi:hypothetical protein